MLRRLGAVLLSTAAAVAAVAPAATAASPRAASYPAAPVYLSAGQQMQSGAQLTQVETTLVMQGDGNLVLYLVCANGQFGPPLWSSGTSGNPGAYAFMQPDGNLVVYRKGRTDPAGALWSTQSQGHPAAALQLNGGGLQIVDSQGYPQWNDGTGFIHAVSSNNVDLPQPGSELPYYTGMQAGTWLESSSVWLLMQNDGNLVLYRKSDGRPLWSSGTSGHPGAMAMLDYGDALSVYLPQQPPQPYQLLWNSPRTNENGWLTGAYLKVQDDANAVVYRQGRTDPAGALWSTGTWGQG
jgi:hypothetical protein